ncbi:hypothetical protein ACIRU8_39800 [Streptomyces sp. NPDC101175]|uniref:hypothetical protein n=1 Tax=Streptomyces sp. NPDC101175 TaxID=3366123 RepID=UPI0038376C6B
MAIELPDNLIALERSAWEEIQAGALTVETALAVREGVAAFVQQAAETDTPLSRLDVEMALKKMVRHPETAAA